MIECQNCKYFEKCPKVGHECTSTADCITYTINPKRTNFDKVILSPKTLAEFVNKIIDLTEICECPMWEFGIKKCTSGSCEECIANWLKQEAEGEDVSQKM